MLYTLGSLSIEVAPFNVDQVVRNTSTDWAEKQVLGAEPSQEWVGEGANTWQLDGTLYPEKLGGLDELEVLHQMRASGQPQYLMRGDGTPLGWVVIKSVTERSAYLNAQGVGKQIKVSINVTRASKPQAGAFFSILSGFFR